MDSKNLMFLCMLLLQISICECSALVNKGEDIGVNITGLLAKRQFTSNPHCPAAEDECICSKTNFQTSWCCRPPCYDVSDPHPLGIVNCQDNCVVYCDRTNKVYCCFCNGIATTSTTTTTTTTTTTSTTTTTATPAPSGGGGCFPATAKVRLESRKLVTMSELQIDDKIETVQSDGKMAYSKVKAFLKKQNSLIMTYKSISTSLNYTIRLTGNHVIYVRKDCNDKYETIFADQVVIGDELLVSSGDEFISDKVIDISTLLMQGAYVPITPEGNIVVDGVLASCYPSYHHDVAHIGMKPLSWFPYATHWIFGGDNGFSVFVKMVEYLGRWVLLDFKYF